MSDISMDNSGLKKITSYPLLITFFVFVFIFFLGYVICPDKEKSEWENRYLSVWPKFSTENLADGKYMADFESYTNDQIVFRDGLIKIKALCQMLLLKNENNGITRGKQGYLFTEDLKDDSVFQKNTKIIQKFIEGIDNDVIVACAPNAVGILKDYIPTGMPVSEQTLKIKDFNNETSLLKNARVVDLVKVLEDHGEEYLYYRTDHHWTTLGAYLAYREISDKPVEIDTLKSNLIDNFYGTLYAKYKGSFVKSDVITYYDMDIEDAIFGDVETDSLYDLSKVEVFDKYGIFLYGNSGISKINVSEVKDGNKLLVFKDSYANSVIPFLTKDYDEITIIDLRFYGESVAALMDEHKDDKVLFLYNYDFLNEDNHFFKLLK